MKILATGNDEIINAWTLNRFGARNVNSNMALAIFDQKQIVGSVFFHAHNGPDIELSYFGPQTLTRGLWKEICRIALDHFGVSRITIRTPKNNKTVTRGIHKLGFVHEGVRHDGYGIGRHAVMFGLYGKKLQRGAGRVMQ